MYFQVRHVAQNVRASLYVQQQAPACCAHCARHLLAAVLKDRVGGDSRYPCISACHGLSVGACGAWCQAQSGRKAACSGTHAAAHDQLLVLVLVCALRLSLLLSATNTSVVSVLLYTAGRPDCIFFWCGCARPQGPAV